MEAELVLHVACDVGTPEGEVAAPGRRGWGRHCQCDSTNTRTGWACLTSSGHHARDRGDVLVPTLGLGAERASPRGGNAIELRALPFVGESPLGLDPPPLFHAVE